MKIMKLKLDNFIGIDHGMGLETLEIDFTDDTNIILFKGANGSGKSTILSQLHPFKQTFDERRYFIVPGKEGLKEMVIVDNDDNEYMIKHVYKPTKDGKHTSSSYIQKNGIELNESGLNSTFEQVMLDEFDITSDYFRISKIGSNTKTFTQLTVGERKNFIGGFLNMEELSIKHSIIDKKVKAMRKDINVLNDNIAKYQDKEILELSINDAMKYIETSENRIKTLYQNQGNSNAILSTVSENLSKINIDQLVSRRDELQTKSNVSSHQNDIAMIYNKPIGEISLQELQTDLPMKREEMVRVESELKSKQSIINTTTDTKNDLSKVVENIENEIRGLTSGLDLKKLEAELLKHQTELNSLTINEETKHLIDEVDITSQIESLGQLASIIQRNWATLMDFKQSTVENIMSNELTTVLNNYKTMILSKVSETHSKNAALNSEIDFLVENSDRYQELLKLRPNECSIDTCPFIKEAAENGKKLENLSGLKQMVAENIESIEKNNGFVEKLDDYLRLQYELYSKLSYVSNKSIFQYFQTMCPIGTEPQQYFNSFQKLKTDLNQDIYNMSQFKILTNKIETLENTIKHEKEKLDIINNRYLKELNENKTKLDKVLVQLNDLGSEVQKLNIAHVNLKHEIVSLTEYIDYLVNYNAMVKELNDISEKIETYNKLVLQNNELVSQIDAIQNELLGLESDVVVKKKSMEENASQLSIVKNIHESLGALNEKYIPMTQIAQSLHPNKGIPLVLMKVYLQATENMANELLNIAFDGMFKIKFITNEKDFFIRVIKSDGSIKEDVKLVSQGEMSLIETSLSLALMAQNMSKFNILTLDEIDGPLDPVNRRRFVQIIKAQMLELGCDQVFIISHNDEFDSEDITTIELNKGSISKK